MLERKLGRYIAIGALLWFWQLGGVAQAQQVPLQIALFKTTSAASELAPLAAALDPVIKAEVGRAPEVSVAAVPPLDLPSLQLALDCVGETPSCLAVAAERSKVTGLLSPTLARAGAALILSLLLYDPQQSQALQVVTRSFSSTASNSVVIDEAKNMVHELFGHAAPPPPPAAEPAPPPATEPVPVEPGSASVEETLPPLTAADTEPRRRPSLLLPVALGAGGVAVIVVGIGFGVASNKSEASYGQTHVMSNSDASQADKLFDRARTQSIIANVAIGVGAASCIAGGIVYFLQRNQRPDTAPERSASARLAIGPGYVGVAGGF